MALHLHDSGVYSGVAVERELNLSSIAKLMAVWHYRCFVDYLFLCKGEERVTHNELNKVAINIITYALEKQKSKAPIDREIHFCCPGCGRPVGVRMAYCSQCGQRLDWRGKDDE